MNGEGDMLGAVGMTIFLLCMGLCAKCAHEHAKHYAEPVEQQEEPGESLGPALEVSAPQPIEEDPVECDEDPCAC